MGLLAKIKKRGYPDIVAGIDAMYTAWAIREADKRAAVQKRYGHYFHPSSLGACPRAAYFRMVTTPSLPEPGLARIFDNGDYMHHRYQKRMWDARQLMGAYACWGCGYEHKVVTMKPQECMECGNPGTLAFDELNFLDHERRISYRPDGFFLHDGKVYILDYKSMNTYQFQNLKELPVKYVRQINFYMGHIRTISMGGFWRMPVVRAAPVVIEDKNTQELKVKWVDFDRDAYFEDLNLIKRIHKCVVNRTPPERPATMRKSCYACVKCFSKAACYRKG